MQNKIIKGTDQPVVMNFTFTGEFASGGLGEFTDIQITIGSEVYTSALNPSEVVVSGNELRLLIGTVTSLDAGGYNLTIVGISPTYDDGYILSGGCINPMRVYVKES